MSYPDAPPLRLSLDPQHKDFHPSYSRVGVRVDGVERRDLVRYDVPAGIYFTRDRPERALAGSIEPFWRWPESRQERRARERWDDQHGAPK